jgi:hypothetical protein
MRDETAKIAKKKKIMNFVFSTLAILAAWRFNLSSLSTIDPRPRNP